MHKHSHRFVEEYDGLVGYGLNRETDESTLICYLQKFSDDEHVSKILPRMSEEEMANLFNLLGALLKKYLTEEEYHTFFLKDDE